VFLKSTGASTLFAAALGLRKIGIGMKFNKLIFKIE
jgi:hypothetical protein